MIRPVIDVVRDAGIVYDIHDGINIDELLKIDMPLFANCHLCGDRNLTMQMGQEQDNKEEFTCEECCSRVYRLEINVRPY